MNALVLSLLILLAIPALAVQEVTFKEVEKIVEKSDIPVVLDIYATWCGPCKFLAPMLEKAESKYKGKIKIIKVDYDKNPDLKGKVRAFPTLVIITKDGDKIKFKTHEGAFDSQKELEKFLDKILKAK